MPLSVAVPWSLTHYIPLNGFHPLYRALFDHAPDYVRLYAWDNVKIQKSIRGGVEFRENFFKNFYTEEANSEKNSLSSIELKRQKYLTRANATLNQMLPGDIEFHHTAPYPSMKRPFIFHCEAFAPIFYPFSHSGGGVPSATGDLRKYFERVFSSELCLGIFSHIPETIESFELFFGNDNINKKLQHTPIGQSDLANAPGCYDRVKNEQRPRFLFINSAHQNSRNFFLRGGHIVLNFWKAMRSEGRPGQLIMRCSRPSDQDFLQYGVDPKFVAEESNKSIIWATGYLSHQELNRLMASAHFFLLPSASLHSASILQAMSAGAIPVVSDTVGTAVFVKHQINGLVLSGVREANWQRDPSTSVLFDSYSHKPQLEKRMAMQMFSDIKLLLDDRGALMQMRQRLLEIFNNHFTGRNFAECFWGDVRKLARHTSSPSGSFRPSKHKNLYVENYDWKRIFESTTQPSLRINEPDSQLFELGGAYVHVAPPGCELHQWSPLSSFFDSSSPNITYATDMFDLHGLMLGKDDKTRIHKLWGALRRRVSYLLLPYPNIHRRVAVAARLVKRLGSKVMRTTSRR